LDENTGFVVGDTGLIIRTTNSGNNWINIPTGLDVNLNGINFYNNSGIIVGGFFSNGRLITLKTTNAGINWIKTFDTIFVFGLNSVKLINSNTGIATGDYGGIMKTTNGGNNWLIQTVGGQNLNSVDFVDSLNGLISGTNGRIIKTTDTGVSWIIQTTGSPYDLNGVRYFNLRSAIAAGENGAVLKSTNGGINWTAQARISTNYFNSVNITNINTSYAFGDFGSIMKTNNAGLVSIKETNQISAPNEFKIINIYPNPFNPRTVINYQLSISNFVSLKVYDVLGNEVANLVNEKKNPGSYKVEFNGSKLSSGIYFVSLLVNGNVIDTKSMVLVK